MEEDGMDQLDQERLEVLDRIEARLGLDLEARGQLDHAR
jgi:hypothetical protein